MGEKLYFEGVEGGPFEPVSTAQMEKKKVLDKVLTVRKRRGVCMYVFAPCLLCVFFSATDRACVEMPVASSQK